MTEALATASPETLKLEGARLVFCAKEGTLMICFNNGEKIQCIFVRLSTDRNTVTVLLKERGEEIEVPLDQVDRESQARIIAEQAATIRELETALDQARNAFERWIESVAEALKTNPRILGRILLGFYRGKTTPVQQQEDPTPPQAEAEHPSLTERTTTPLNLPRSTRTALLALVLSPALTTSTIPATNPGAAIDPVPTHTNQLALTLDPPPSLRTSSNTSTLDTHPLSRLVERPGNPNTVQGKFSIWETLKNAEKRGVHTREVQCFLNGETAGRKILIKISANGRHLTFSTQNGISYYYPSNPQYGIFVSIGGTFYKL